MTETIEIRLPDNPRRYRVGGRVAQIVRWLLENEGRLVGPQVQLTFHCRNGTVRVEEKRYEDVT